MSALWVLSWKLNRTRHQLRPWYRSAMKTPNFVSEWSKGKIPHRRFSPAKLWECLKKRGNFCNFLPKGCDNRVDWKGSECFWVNELGLKWCMRQFISSIQTQLSSIERCQFFEQNQWGNQKAQLKEQIVFRDSLGWYKWVRLQFILWDNSRLIWVEANHWFKGESFISCNTGQMWLIYRYFLFEKFLIFLFPYVLCSSFILFTFD